MDTDRKMTQQFLLQGYLLCITLLLPLYTANGYSGLGEAKFQLWRIFSIAAAAILIPIFGYGLRENNKMGKKHKWEISDILLLTFFLVTWFAFFLSEEKSAGLWGLTGWRMGALSWSLMLFFFIAFRYGLYPAAYTKYLVLVGPFLVALLGLLNRFGIYPIPSLAQSGSVQNNSFLSTIGNINWYCGFLVLFLAVAAGELLVTTEVAGQIYFGAFWLIGLMSALTQGSDGILLPLGTMGGILLVLSLRHWQSFRNFLRLLLLFGISSEADLVLFRLFPERYHYDADNLCIRIIDSHVGLVIVAAMIFSLILMEILKEKNIPWYPAEVSRAFTWVLALCLLGIPLFVLLMQMQSDFLADQSATLARWMRFLTREDFGNGRGAIWKISVKAYRNMSPMQKLFGIGLQEYTSFCYGNPSVRAMIVNAFGDHRLTNAHSILFTMLMECGWVGLLSFLGLLGTLLYKAAGRLTISRGQKATLGGTLLFLLIGVYLSYGLISFDQIMMTPYFFILLGTSWNLLEN